MLFYAMLSVLLAAVNIYSVKLATYLQNVTTVTKLIALLIITAGGLFEICSGKYLP